MRPALHNLLKTGCAVENAGQALAYLLQGHDRNHELKRALLNQVIKIKVPGIYTSAYEDWRSYATAQGWACDTVSLAGRMFIGLGAATVLETHVTLHRVYGVPYIPGSALKGLARAYAENLIDDSEKFLSDEQIHWLFGNPDASSAGQLDFQDAWWVPKGSPLCLEVETPHHKDYYGTAGKVPATDFDDPTPLQQLAVQGGFFLSIAGDAFPAQLAMAVLKKALQDWGIGGRVNADYGRFDKTDAAKTAFRQDGTSKQ